MVETKHFGRIVRERRERRNLKIDKLAELCGLSYKGLEGIELGDSDPKLSSVLRIASVLDLDLGDLNACIPAVV